MFVFFCRSGFFLRWTSSTLGHALVSPYLRVWGRSTRLSLAKPLGSVIEYRVVLYLGKSPLFRGPPFGGTSLDVT